LTLDPKHSGALRYRADARFQQDKIDEALTDVEAALTMDPTSVETALLRGKIREAIRLAEVEATSKAP